MAPVRIISRKVGNKNGMRRFDFAGDLASDDSVVFFPDNTFSLTLSDGERIWSVMLDEKTTDVLAQRFAERQGAMERAHA